MTKTNIILINREISIFRTSVNSKCDIEKIKPLLDHLIGIENWNFDMEDSEKILRINNFPNMNNFIAKEINKMGFECIEIF
jgi:hypothetical protein